MPYDIPLKKFDGKTYKFYRHLSTKGEARALANVLRKRSKDKLLVRITKEKYFDNTRYFLYTRSK